VLAADVVAVDSVGVEEVEVSLDADDVPVLDAVDEVVLDTVELVDEPVLVVDVTGAAWQAPERIDSPVDARVSASTCVADTLTSVMDNGDGNANGGVAVGGFAAS
jgi:hypothetical protein